MNYQAFSIMTYLMNVKTARKEMPKLMYSIFKTNHKVSASIIQKKKSSIFILILTLKPNAAMSLAQAGW